MLTDLEPEENCQSQKIEIGPKSAPAMSQEELIHGWTRKWLPLPEAADIYESVCGIYVHLWLFWFFS
jgi:hypothetical protein